MSFHKPVLNNQRGVTLVELMIVVAIIGILAGLASIGYVRYVRSAKLTQLKAHALAVASGQKQYKADRQRYLNAGTYAAAPDKFQNLLGFSNQVADGIVIATEAWDAGGTCTQCTTYSVSDPSSGSAGFAVIVTQDMNPGTAAATTVLVSSEQQNPVVYFEGE